MSIKLLTTSILALGSIAAHAEQNWIKDGGVQRFFTGTSVSTTGDVLKPAEKIQNYSINFKEDAKYFFTFSVYCGGATYMTNTTDVMFGISGDNYALVVGKSANTGISVSEMKEPFFNATSLYAFSAESFSRFPSVTNLDSTPLKGGNYTYEITLITSSSGNGKLSVGIPELKKQAEFDLKLAEDMVTSYVGVRLCGESAQSSINKERIASIGMGIAMQKYILQKADSNLPEPSAFGFLAGFVSLAFVGSRRRR